MHYANGREAKNGDKVVLFDVYGGPFVGILYDAVAGNDFCNGKIAYVKMNDPCPNLRECLHLEDVLGLIPASPDQELDKRIISVPDLSKKSDGPAS